jgi:hypothetical protein
MRRPALMLIVVALLAAGCARGHARRSDDTDGVPPVAESAPATRSPRLPSPPPLSPPPFSPPARASAGPSPTGFSELTSVPCGGRPSGEQVIALLHRASVVAASVRPTITTGPLCAGTWQYTAVSVGSHEPLHAVSKGPPTALQLVTAGTNPCSARVRAEAPPGILAILQC